MSDSHGTWSQLWPLAGVFSLRSIRWDYWSKIAVLTLYIASLLYPPVYHNWLCIFAFYKPVGLGYVSYFEKVKKTNSSAALQEEASLKYRVQNIAIFMICIYYNFRGRITCNGTISNRINQPNWLFNMLTVVIIGTFGENNGL